MSKIEKACGLAEQIANDNSHGYLWGGNGPVDFDCSGLVNYVWQQAGVPVNAEVRNTTSSAPSYYPRHGFSDVTGQVNLATGAGLKRGDVLINRKNHMALYTGGGKLVQARSNLDGKSGDSSGQEIRVQNYYNYPWDCVLRYTAEDAGADGGAASEGGGAQAEEPFLPCAVKLPLLKDGAKGGWVKSLQLVLIGKGVRCGPCGADGEFGPGTKGGVMSWQRGHGLEVDGICGEQTWASVLKE